MGRESRSTRRIGAPLHRAPAVHTLTGLHSRGVAPVPAVQRLE